MDFDRARVDRGEEILSKKRREAERQQRDAEEAAGKPEAALQRQLQQTHIAPPQPLEMMLEPVLKAGEKAGFGRIVASSTRVE